MGWQYLDFEGFCEAWVALGGCALTPEARQRPEPHSSDEDAEPEELTQAMNDGSDTEDGKRADDDRDDEGDVLQQHPPLPDDDDEAVRQW
eukprot:COSAG06_NODE_5778_length_3278_cov_2.766279_2_plen_90_part_00